MISFVCYGQEKALHTYTFIIMLVYIPIIAMRIFIDPFAFAVQNFNIA